MRKWIEFAAALAGVAALAVMLAGGMAGSFAALAQASEVPPADTPSTHTPVSGTPDGASGPVLDPAQMAPAPIAGLYKARLTFVSLNIGRAPAHITQRIGEGMNRKFEYCLKPDDIAEGYPSILRRSQEGDCSVERFERDEDRVRARMICTAQGNRARVDLRGTATPTASNIRMTIAGNFGGRSGTLTMRAQHEWAGECS